MNQQPKKIFALSSDESSEGSFGRFSYSGSSWKGQTRSSNQDSFGLVFTEKGGMIAAVADGMGGHAGGDVASSTAVSLTSEAADTLTPKGGSESINALFNKISSRLGAIQQESRQLSGLGTTLSMVILDESNLTTAHVGDSRIYRARGSKLDQLTKDHSWVQQQVDMGLLTEEEATTHPRRNIITKALGVDQLVAADIDSFKINAGDRYLITSDGIHGAMSQYELKQALQTKTPDQCLVQLLDTVRRNGAPDNATAIVIDVKRD